MSPRDNEKDNEANPHFFTMFDRVLTLFQQKPTPSIETARLGYYISRSDSSAAASTDEVIMASATPTLFQPKKEINSLLQYAANSEWDIVDKLLMASPDLLTVRGSVVRQIDDNRAHQFTDITVWQIALKIKQANQENVFAMLKKHFTRIKNGNGLVEMAKQFHEIFSDGVIKKYDWDVDCSSILFRGLCDAIAISDNPFADNIVQNQVKMFFDYAIVCMEKKKGLAFEMQVLIDIMEFMVSRRIRNIFVRDDQYRFYEQMIYGYAMKTLLPPGCMRSDVCLTLTSMKELVEQQSESLEKWQAMFKALLQPQPKSRL